MTTEDLCFASIHQLASALQKGDISPVELTQAYLERIQQFNDKLNAYITVTADRALKEAKEAEIEIRQQGPRDFLHGIPLAHKDIAATKGVRTTSGSKVFPLGCMLLKQYF